MLWYNSSTPRSSRQAVGEPDAPTWKLTGTQGTTALWMIPGAPLRHQKFVKSCIHPQQYGPFPGRLKLPYSDDDIWSGYEEDLSSVRDTFTAWVKTDFVTTLYDMSSTNERRRQNFANHPAGSTVLPVESIIFITTCPTIPLYKKDSASTFGTLDPAEAKKGPSRNRCRQVAHHHGTGSDRVCRPRASQESVRKSIYLHDVRLDLPDKVVEGETGSVIQGVISRATFSMANTQRPKNLYCLVPPH